MFFRVANRKEGGSGEINEAGIPCALRETGANAVNPSSHRDQKVRLPMELYGQHAHIVRVGDGRSRFVDPSRW